METLLNNKAAMIGLAVLAFLVAALLVLAIVRMLFGARLRMPGGRARQARLGIVDAFDLDRQRQLIIVRRDNTEHLIMIGGPNDLLIESEIVRVEARELRDARRDKPADTLAAGYNEARIPAPAPAERDMPAFTFPPQSSPAPSAPAPMVNSPPVSPTLPEVTLPIEPVLSGPVLAAPEPSGPVVSEPVPSAQVSAPLRTPTFPLPPRRPVAPAPDRRPAPPPLRLPDSVTRNDEPAQVLNAGAAASPPPVAQPGRYDGLPEAVADPAPAVSPAPARPAPPLLKPRPPIRPLQRTIPQPPMRSPGGPAVTPASAPIDAPLAATPRPPSFRPLPATPPPAPSQPAAIQPPGPAPTAPQAAESDPKDALESLGGGDGQAARTRPCGLSRAVAAVEAAEVKRGMVSVGVVRLAAGFGLLKGR